MLGIISMAYWLGVFVSVASIWFSIVAIQANHTSGPLWIIASAIVWPVGGYRLLGLLKARRASRLKETVQAIAPAGFMAEVQIADDAGRRYVGIDPSAKTVVVIDAANGIRKVMPLSQVSEWETQEDPSRNYQRVTVRFSDFQCPSISIPVLTRHVERIASQLRVAIG
ncbi:hypothetical protein HFK89_03655 [Ralstonia pseudosolanacearum]|uniref:hypothetical protein n=1 Tax=Ralstonia pseudosolanacearum TaxID=1310165 RepID=UPI0008F93F1A|nr:hypothetical protein [Ralstonia pseudosolanacearum]MCK4161561.1 hypothetical protein [Ralstonia pseudosolanacearum]OIN72126.1 hypothetical protein BL248_16645 [Ralstonia solanacearum]